MQAACTGRGQHRVVETGQPRSNQINNSAVVSGVSNESWACGDRTRTRPEAATVRPSNE